MKLGLMKRMIATGLCAALLFADILPASATVAESVSSGNAVVESVSDNNAVVALEPVTVDGVTITVSGPASAFAEGTTVSAVAVDPAEVVIAAAEENEQATVKKYKAFDINLICGGEVVQPLNGQEIKVNFEGDMLIPDVENNEAVAVYHVDEDDNITKMDAEIVPLEVEDTEVAETVEMTTTHFSTYVVLVTDVVADRVITFRHYLVESDELLASGQYNSTNSSQFYAPEGIDLNDLKEKNELEEGDMLYSDLPVKGGTNFRLLEVRVLDNQGKVVKTYNNDETDSKTATIDLGITHNTIELYYAEATHEYENAVTFYDYYIDTRIVKQDKKIASGNNGQPIIRKITVNEKEYRNVKLRNNNTLCDGYFYSNVVLNMPNKVMAYDIELSNGQKYDSLYFDYGGFYTYRVANANEQADATFQYNSGINAVGASIAADPNKAFLAMGCSDTTKPTVYYGTGGNQNDVHGFSGYKIDKVVNGNRITNLIINDNNTDGGGVRGSDRAIVPGIITGLSGKNSAGYYETINFGKTNKGQQIVDPGYFTNENIGDYKYVYDNYYLSFHQEGNNYELNYAYSVDQAGTEISRTYSKELDSEGNNTDVYSNRFLPLSNVEFQGGRGQFQPFLNDAGHRTYNATTGEYLAPNFFFGMRYDFTFSIGDYIGDMNYEFIGDDDLWVFVDGKIVMDLGGLHSKYPGNYAEAKMYESNKVDLWDALYGISEDERTGEWWKLLTKEQKEETHTVTVLYMERGAWDSTCGMKFVIPNATEVVPTISKVPKADVTLTKENSETKAAIEGVQFTLFSNEACTDKLQEVASGKDGKVTFKNLKKGTYYIKETGYNQNEYYENNNLYKVEVTVDIKGEQATATAAVTVKKGDQWESLLNNVIYNVPVPKVDISFKKVQEDNVSNALQGAEFTLVSSDSNKYGRYNEKASSDENGEFTFSNLKEGTYVLTEIKAPDGFTNPGTESLTIVVDANGNYTVQSTDNIWLTFDQTSDVVVLKNVKSVEVTVNKAWENFKGEKLTEAPVDQVVFELRRKAEGAVDSEIVKEITVTEANGWTATETGLPCKNSAGKAYLYEVVEKTEVEGFTVSTSNDADADAYKYAFTVTNIQQPGALKIIKEVDKVDMVYGEATFTFEITCPDGTKMYRVLSFKEGGNKEVVIDNLVPGEYVVKELDTLRYTCQGEKVLTKDVEAGKTTDYMFQNKLTGDGGYSHSDVVVNSFRRNANGEIEISKNREVIEQAEVDNQ